MSENCTLCNLPVDKYNPDTWKQVTGYVGGPKKDSMRLREDTGLYAHDECVKKLSAGQTVDQPSMFDDAVRPVKTTFDEALPEELQ